MCWAEALEIFKCAIDLNPKDREAWTGQGSSLANLDREYDE
jgi:Flp pilus assembly protein TadD